MYRNMHDRPKTCDWKTKTLSCFQMAFGKITVICYEKLEIRVLYMLLPQFALVTSFLSLFSKSEKEKKKKTMFFNVSDIQ